MKILANVKTKAKSVVIKSEKAREAGYSWESDFYHAYDLTTRGNVCYAGWNCPQGTVYTEHNDCFLVEWCSVENKPVLVSSLETTYKDVSDKILWELWEMQENI